MSGLDLGLRIEGPDSAAIANEVADLIEAEFGERPEPRAPDSARGPSSDPERFDPAAAAAGAAIATAILALPGAMKNAADLADRYELGQKLDRFLARLRQIVKDRVEVRITFVPKKGPSIRVERAKPSDLMEEPGPRGDDSDS